MNPLLSDDEQAVRDAARTLASDSFAGAEITAAGVRTAVASIVEAEGVDAHLHLALAIEEIARVNPGAGAAVGSAAAADLVLAGCGRSAEGLAVCVHGTGMEFGESGPAGVSEAVAGGSFADGFVVAGDDAVWLVTGTATAADLDGLAGSGLATVEISGGERIGGADVAETARALLRLQQAAVAVGISAAAQDAALDSIAAAKAAGERPDRSQAVQWALADIATEAEAARVATWHAACADSTDQGSAMALVLATDSAVNAARRAATIGGVDAAGAGGRMAGLQRDAKLIELLGGGPAAQLGVIGDALLPDVPRA